MQRKLQRRLLSKKDAPSEENPKLLQWIALQAKARKLTVDEFRELYSSKQRVAAAVPAAINSYRGSERSELEALSHAVVEAAGWFPGGYKEMKDRDAAWSAAERKLDAINSWLALDEDMRVFVRSLNEIAEAKAVIEMPRIREMFGTAALCACDARRYSPSSLGRHS